MSQVIDLDRIDETADWSEPIAEISLIYLHNYLYYHGEEFRLIPSIRRQYTLEELRQAYEDIEGIENMDSPVIFSEKELEQAEKMSEEELESFLKPTEEQLRQRLELEKSEENRLEYKVEVVEQGKVIIQAPPYKTLVPAIITRFKYMSQPDGKIKAVYRGMRYEIPVSISECVSIGDRKLEKLVLGKPEIVGEVRK